MILASTSTSISESILLALVVVILVGPFVVRLLFLPATIGLVLGGAIIGPDALGWVAEGQLDNLGDLGLLYLMFLAGLELDMNLFRRYRKTAFAFGGLSFTLPFVLGLAAGLALDYSRSAAILLGSIWASHTLISLPDVKRFGLSGNRAVAITVSATALTDTLALVVLAVVTSGAADEPGSSPMVKLVLGLITLGLYCLWFLPRLGEVVFRTLALERTNRVVFMLGAFSSAALVATAFGIEGLVGAFLAGMGVNRLAPAGGALVERVEFFGSALFIPAFLIFVGTQLDLAVLASWETLGLAAIFVAVVIVGKVAAAAITGWREGFTFYEVGIMAGLSIGQAAATLAATLVGQAVGLFDDEVVNGVLVAVLVTILISSITTSWFGRRIPPDRSIVKPLMSKLLIAVPPGGADEGMLRFAAHVARKSGAEIVPVRVVEPGLETDGRDEADAELERAERQLTGAGTDVVGILRIDSSTNDGIINVIHEQGASLLVLPRSRRLTVTERVFGDPFVQIGQRSPIPVAFGRVPNPKFERAVLVLEKRPDRGLGADAEVGARVLTSVVATFENVTPVVVIEHGDGSPLHGLTLPDDVEIETSAELDEAWLRNVPSTDLLILTSALLYDAGFRVEEIADEEVGVLVVAGPHRLGLRSPAAPPPAEGVLGFVGR